jgi:hypothetical protein
VARAGPLAVVFVERMKGVLVRLFGRLIARSLVRPYPGNHLHQTENVTYLCGVGQLVVSQKLNRRRAEQQAVVWVLNSRKKERECEAMFG